MPLCDNFRIIMIGTKVGEKDIVSIIYCKYKRWKGLEKKHWQLKIVVIILLLIYYLNDLLVSVVKLAKRSFSRIHEDLLRCSVYIETSWSLTAWDRLPISVDLNLMQAGN